MALFEACSLHVPGLLSVELLAGWVSTVDHMVMYLGLI